MIQAVLHGIKAVLWRVLSVGRSVGWKKLAVGALGIVVGVSVVSSFVGDAQEITPEPNDVRTVEVRSVAELMAGGSSLNVVGTVSSQAQATVRAEAAGAVTRVYYSLGQNISAGTIVAELENASERAALLQAEGSLEAAQAGAGVSQTTLSAAKDSAVNALLSAYSVADKTIRTDIDPMFSNPTGAQPQFTVPSSDSQAVIDIQSARVALSMLLARQNTSTATLSPESNLPQEFAAAEAEMRTLRSFLDTLIRALNAGIAAGNVTEATINAHEATATSARAAINASLSSLISARQALETAEKNSNTTGTSATQAAIKQAEGGVAAARANLEKKIIRAPISGTINSFSLKVGDFVQSFEAVLTVANNRALEITTYLTEEDARNLNVGLNVTVRNYPNVRATITRIAPAIDPATRKIEVRVGLSNTEALLNGQSVTLTFAREEATSEPTGPIAIPIAALKIGAENTVVFSVSAESTLIALPVVVGTLLGDRVVIAGGLTPEIEIVTDARGLQEGQKVVVR